MIKWSHMYGVFVTKHCLSVGLSFVSLILKLLKWYIWWFFIPRSPDKKKSNEDDGKNQGQDGTGGAIGGFSA